MRKKIGVTPGGRKYEAARFSKTHKITTVSEPKKFPGVGQKEFTKQTVPKNDVHKRKPGTSKISYSGGNRTYDVKKGPTKPLKKK